MVITSVRQKYEYESIESRNDYRTRTEIIYKGRETSIKIGKFKNNYDKDKKLRCFNYNIYKHMAKNC